MISATAKPQHLFSEGIDLIAFAEERGWRKLRALTLLVVSIWSSCALAQNSPELLSNMTGTWDVQQRMWPGPKADALNLPPAVAERRLVRGAYLEEIMQPADAPAGQSGGFTRHALLNYNPVTSRYEYTSIDTRAPQLMLEQSLPVVSGPIATELKLQGGSFLAPEWGTFKNVRFKYRLTIGTIREGKHAVRLFLTPETVLAKVEFLAFEYVYTKRP